MEKRELGEYSLSALRILIGWIMLWPFFDKLLGLGFETPSGGALIDGVSPSSYVLYVTDGIFKGLYEALAGNGIADALMMLGLLVLGVTLILGIASKLTTVATSLFMFIMYTLHVPPQDNPIIDYHILLIVALVAIYGLGGYERLSVYDRWKNSALVKRFPILE